MRIGPLNISWSNERRDEYAWKQDLGKFVSCLTGGYSEENLIKLFESIPEVFAPIDTIAGAVCSAKWELRKIADDEVVYNNADWNRIYEKPNWKQDWQKMIYNAVVSKYVTGNRYFYTYIPSTSVIKMANVVNLWVLAPQFVTPKVKTERPNYLQVTTVNDIVDYYDYAEDRDRLKISPEYIHHDTHIDVKSAKCYDLLKGTSPLLCCEYPMSNLMAVYEARNVIYVKRGALGMIVSKKSDASGLQALTKSEKEQLVKDHHDSYGVTKGKSPIAITSMPVDFIKTGLSISELEPFVETDASSDAIYGALRVPRELKPRNEGATYENQKTARRSLYTNVAIPEAVQLAVILSGILKLKELGLYLFPSFNHVEDLQENKKEKSEVDWKNNETSRVRFLHGIITLNEWIVETGYEQVSGVPLYDKRIFQMDETEQALVKAVIGMKAVSLSVNDNNNGNEEAGK